MTVSAIVFGRNDNYGYNIHKRITLSLNAIAEVLTDGDDEIIFVDYNTDDLLPTAIECIADTLTDRAKSLIKIIRVRPHHHMRFRKMCNITNKRELLDATARNVAIRRSNPKNNWILSTITDMIFVCDSLSDIIKNLSIANYYGIPRYSLPEMLWESLDRTKGRGNIIQVKEWSEKYNLNMIGYDREQCIKFLSPGDFQLIPRQALFDIQGFDEEMVYGFHNDSNIAKRIGMYLGNDVISLQNELSGYHCDHTKSADIIHGRVTTENSLKYFFKSVKVPYLPKQEKYWGMKDYNLETFTLQKSKEYIQVANEAIETLPNEVGMVYDNNAIQYHTRHACSFLMNELYTLENGITVAYIGYNRNVCQVIQRIASVNKFQVIAIFLDEKIDYTTIKNVLGYGLIVYDCGLDIANNKLLCNVESDKLKNILLGLIGMGLYIKSSMRCIILNHGFASFKYYERIFLWIRKPSYNNIFYGQLALCDNILSTISDIAMPILNKKYIPGKTVKENMPIIRSIKIALVVTWYVITAKYRITQYIKL